jgi:hypothetical protein
MRFSRNSGQVALFLVLATAGTAALGGCYTVLKHPPTAEVADGGENRRDCYDCHGGEGPAFAYDPMAVHGFDYLADNWYPWYAYPWWYRDYWYWDRYEHAGDNYPGYGDEEVQVPDLDEGRRHLWGRGVGYAPPSVPPLVGAPPPPGSGGGGTNPSGKKEEENGRTMKTGSTEGQPSGNNGDKGDEKKDAKETKDNDRQVWGRGGSKGGQ